MNIKHVLHFKKTNTLIIPFFKNEKIDFKEIIKVLPILKKDLSNSNLINDFKGKKNELHLFYVNNKSISRIILLGLGEPDFSTENIRKSGGKAYKKIKELNITNAVLFSGKQQTTNKFLTSFLEGFLLAGYIFNTFKKTSIKKETQLKELSILTTKTIKKIPVDIKSIQKTCQAVMYVRDLVNTPGNKLVPDDLAKEATKISRENKNIKIKILKEKQLIKQGFGALMAVGQGSINPPRLIIMEYKSKNKNAPNVAIVGKGITFDTGGINLKPSGGISDMKLDMAGAATVLGIFKILVQKEELPVNLIGVISAAENAISDRAIKPGDIITSYSGKTIEITNTDAEGRLVLADAISYTLEKYKIKYLLDFATLTEACIVALGNDITGVVSNSESLVKMIKKSSQKTDEKIWELPLDKDLKDKTKGDIADLINWTANVQAGAIMVAAFISQFVEKTTWAHFDIAGTAWTKNNSEYLSKGGTGRGVRLLWDLLHNL